MNETNGSERNDHKKVALITGGSRNIGREIAKALAKDGVTVWINAHASAADAERAAQEIREEGGDAHYVIADISDPKAVLGMMEQIMDLSGHLDTLVNNAAYRANNNLEDISIEEWDKVIDITLRGTFLCCQLALPALEQSPCASIINIGGVAASVGVAKRCHVAAAKAGIIGLTRALAAELAEKNILVNCVSPGHIDTKRDGEVPPHFRLRPPPVGRAGTVSEVASIVRYLADSGNRFITGQTINVNGGWYMN